jgi:hypothetical protein
MLSLLISLLAILIYLVHFAGGERRSFAMFANHSSICLAKTALVWSALAQQGGCNNDALDALFARTIRGFRRAARARLHLIAQSTNFCVPPTFWIGTLDVDRADLLFVCRCSRLLVAFASGIVCFDTNPGVFAVAGFAIEGFGPTGSAVNDVVGVGIVLQAVDIQHLCE